MEDSRVEILGSMNYPGIATNIKSKFDDKCKLYESFEDHEDHLEIALETWLRNLCLPDIESSKSSLFLKYFETKIKIFVLPSLLRIMFSVLGYSVTKLTFNNNQI